MSKVAKAKSALATALAAMTSELGAIRARIAKLKERVEIIENAPVDQATALERVEDMIARLADGWHSPAVADMCSADRHRDSPEIFGRLVLGPGDDAAFLAPVLRIMVQGALCSIFEPAIREHYTAQLREFYASADVKPLTDTERAAALKKAKADLLALELEEENLIEQAEAEGFEIARRGDADPSAVLGLEVAA